VTTIAILGAGRLGLRIASALSSEHHVRASTRSPGRFPEIMASGAEPCVAELSEPGALIPLLEGADLAIWTASAGREGPSLYREECFRIFLTALFEQAVPRLLLVSSTAVYGAGAPEVDETTRPEPSRLGGRQILAAEAGARALLGKGLQILRLAGLYDAQRGPFHLHDERLAQGLALPGSGQRILNLIHDEDAAALLLAQLERPELTMLVGVDEQPLPRAELYGQVATHRGYPAPLFREPEEAASGLRCRSRARPIPLRFPSLTAALEAGEA